MNAETLEALKASIEKWKRNAVAAKPSHFKVGSLDCPLCALFYEQACRGCPVRMRTKRTGCERTPYLDAYIALRKWESGVGNADTAHEAARAEVSFLESLLPVPAKSEV